jgi:hypothetical protein
MYPAGTGCISSFPDSACINPSEGWAAQPPLRELDITLTGYLLQIPSALSNASCWYSKNFSAYLISGG